MAFARPPLAQLRTQARADIAARFPALDAQLPRSIVNAIADALGGMTWLLYGYLTWLATQLLPDTATGIWLTRWLRIKNIVETAAVAWVGYATFTGVNGTPIPARAQFKTPNGQVYATNADGVIASGTATLVATATVSGSAGNANNGATGTLATAIAGIAATVTIGATITAGVDQETDDSARTRLLLALRNPAMGGAQSDYLQWALASSPSVTRAWVVPNGNGAGTVVVLFAVDDDVIDGPIPDSGDIAALQAALNAKAPVTAEVIAAAPTADTIDFTIAGLTIAAGFTLATVKANIQAAIVDLFRQDGAPGGTVQLQAISDAITRAGGVTGFDLTVPAADVTSASGHIPVAGTFTWT